MVVMEPEFTTDEETIGSKIKNNFYEFFQFVAIIAGIFIFLRFFVAEPHRVDGNSMLPNFHHGDYIITNKLLTKLGEPQRGEVVILKNPRKPDEAFIKRIIGLPGDRIKIQADQVYINDQLINEPYLLFGLPTPTGAFLSEGEEITVPDGQYFVIGDNRSGSSDSRDWGTVKREALIGQAWLRYWPLTKLTFISINTPSR